MYDPNAQKDLLILRSELNDCCYDPKMRDYLQGLIIRIMNYPKKAMQCRHFVKIMDQKKIMMIWYPLNILFANKNYSIPIQIYITKNIPYEPPQIFLELKKGTGVNPKNKDIDPKNNRIMTKTLRSWNQNSNIENVLGEIFESFSRLFPIYKKKTDQQIPIPNQAQQGGGGNYGMFQNEMNNSYQKQNSDNSNNNFSNPYNPQGKYGFQPPTKNIYGRSMTLDSNRNYQQPNSFGGGIYGNNNNQKPNSFGGGIYDNNNQKPNSFGGGIYDNNNQQPNSFGGGIYDNNNKQPNSFGGGIYGNNNNQKPNSFGGGIYGNNNNQKPNSFGGGIYDNNNNQRPNSFGGGIYGNNNNNNNNQGGRLFGNNDNNNQNNQFGRLYSGPASIQPFQNPKEELKNILINGVSEKISNKLIKEKKRLNNQNEKMKEYKIKLKKENEKLQKFLDNQSKIKFNCEEDMSNMNKAIQKIQLYNKNNKIMILNQNNCLNYLDIPDSKAIKIIAEETCMEEMILIVRKGFERKKISLNETINFMRNSTRDLFAIKFLKDKAINKYKY